MAKRARIKKIRTGSHLFPFNWTLANAMFPKNKGKVFSCFACGGGSTMGYKLAGFDVLGCNEIDPEMAACYQENHHPKYLFREPIQEFKTRMKKSVFDEWLKTEMTDDDIRTKYMTSDEYQARLMPEELFHLDILDGSPPCSSFSMAGNRDDDWGKEKVFREGQASQVLDTLFFDFIDLAKKLQPKIVSAENVKGLLMGNAREYVKKILEAFDDAGYYVQFKLLNASFMGVPQKRERVFFIAIRKDLAGPFMKQIDMFTQIPVIDLEFNEKEIKFSEVFQEKTPLTKECIIPESHRIRWDLREQGDKSLADCDMRMRGKSSFFNSLFLYKNGVLPTLTATRFGWPVLFDEPRTLSHHEFCLAGSYPVDYNFLTNEAGYLIGMSVPPVMVAQIATRIFDQWLSKINNTEHLITIPVEPEPPAPKVKKEKAPKKSKAEKQQQLAQSEQNKVNAITDEAIAATAGDEDDDLPF